MTGFITTAVTGVFLLQSLSPMSIALSETVREEPVLPTYPTLNVSMTAYNAVPEQTDSSPNHTAIGAYTNPEIIAARSVDLADELPWGTVIEVTEKSATSTNASCGQHVVHDQIGLRVIADSMHPRKRNQIDILLDHTKTVKIGTRRLNPARVMGMCKNVEIRIVGKIDVSNVRNLPSTQEELRFALAESLKQEVLSDEVAIANL